MRFQDSPNPQCRRPLLTSWCCRWLPPPPPLHFPISWSLSTFVSINITTCSLLVSIDMASRRSALAIARSVSDAASWYLALALVAVVVVSTLREGSAMANLAVVDEDAASGGGRLVARPCDEIYVVGEGETLHTISDKCGDPFILERNPHIHDPDDVFPGLIIKITPSTNPK